MYWVMHRKWNARCLKPKSSYRTIAKTISFNRKIFLVFSVYMLHQIGSLFVSFPLQTVNEVDADRLQVFHLLQKHKQFTRSSTQRLS